MLSENRYYQSSGIVPLLGIIPPVIFGTIAALILAAVYSQFIFWVPFIYLNFFATLICGLGVGFATSLGIKKGKIRNVSISVLIAFVMGCVALYLSWIGWIYALSDYSEFYYLPNEVWNIVTLISEKGYWSIGSAVPTGIVLYIVWAIEACMIIGACAVMVLADVSSSPFCELCDSWIDEGTSVEPLLPVENSEEFVLQLEEKNYSSLLALQKSEEAINSYIQASIRFCNDCAKEYYLTLQEISISFDEKNEESKEENILVENLIIDEKVYNSLKDSWAL